jgi:predicted nucleotidyltransferase
VHPEPSGKFVIRLPPKLHASLRKRARDTGVSLNSLCLAALKQQLGEGGQCEEAGEIPVRQIKDLVGGSLVGVLLFGSAARGEQRADSDIDLLVVVGPEVPLSRALYGRWDDAIGNDTTLSPHFVHLPRDIRKAGSIWCEAAVDGTTLYDRDGDLGRLLREMRRSMAEGRIRRKSAYGHPYWMHTPQEAADV